MTTPLLQHDHLRQVRSTWVRALSGTDTAAIGIATMLKFFRKVPLALNQYSFKAAQNLEANEDFVKFASDFMSNLSPAIYDDNKLGEIADIVHDCGCDLAFFGCQVEHLEDILESLRAVVNETLGSRYTGQVEEAWIAVCNAFLYVMQPALAESLVEFPWNDPNLSSLDIASPEAAQLLKSSWDAIKAKKADISIKLFEHMFKISPSMRELCASLSDPQDSKNPPPTLPHVAEVFLTEIGFSVNCLTWRPMAIGYLLSMAENQSNVFDLEIEHMVFFGKSLLWVLRDALGSKWTTDVEDAWRDHWGSIHEATKLVLNRKREPPGRKKMRDLERMYGKDKQGAKEDDKPVTRKVGFVETPEEVKRVVSEMEDARRQKDGKSTATSPGLHKKVWVPPTSSSLVGSVSPRQDKPSNSSTTIVAGSSSAMGRPALSPRIDVDGLHRSPPHVPAMAEPAKASPPASAQAKPATVFHFTGTCLLHKLLPDGTVELIKNAEAYSPEGLLGIVILSSGNSPRKILVYNEMKKQCFSSPIDANNVCLWPDKPLSFKVTKEGQEAHILSFKSIADQIKFGVQVATGKAMHWPGIDGPMISDDLMFGTGRTVKAGSTVEVRFIAWAEGPAGRGDLGDEFDGNVAENAPPLRFVVGQKEVLQGLDEGAVGMRQGGIRRLVIPPQLAYGKDGVQGIVPPNSVVHIELTIEKLVADENANVSPLEGAKAQNESGSQDNNSSDKSAEVTVSPTFHYARMCTLFKAVANKWELVSVENPYGDKGQLGIVIVSASTPERKILLYDKNKQAVVQSVVGAQEDTCQLTDLDDTFEMVVSDNTYRFVLKNAAEAIKFGTQLALSRIAAYHDKKLEETPMIMQDLVHGSGPAAEQGDRVFLRYQGWLEGEGGRGTMGAMFDCNTSEDADILEFSIGDGQVVVGLDKGVSGMKAGGKRFIILPPHTGYGVAGVEGSVPPNSVVYLELELKQVVASKAQDGRSQTDLSSYSNNMINASRSFEAESSSSANINDQSDASARIPSIARQNFADQSQHASGVFSNGMRSSEAMSNVHSTASGPMFHHMSTCHVLKASESGFTPCNLPGYGKDKSLGYVIMSPEEGVRKLIVYAPVLQADLSPDASSVVAADPESGLVNCFNVSDEEGQGWLMALKGPEQAARLQKQLQTAKGAAASSPAVQLSDMQDVPAALLAANQ